MSLLFDLAPRVLALLQAALFAIAAHSAPFSVGAAPKGEAKVVASRIIKQNFPACRQVSQAVRQPDGSIRAVCDGTHYLVFTVFNPKEGEMMEVAMNCSAAKKLDISC